MIWCFTLPLVLCAVPLTMASSTLWEALAASTHATHFLYGAGAGVVIGLLILKFFPLLFVLDHELTHFVAALAMLRKPLLIAAEARSGVVIIEGRGSTFVSLAPHAIPILALLALSLLLITDAPSRPYVVALIALAWGYHGVTDVFDAVTGGSDLAKGGVFASRVLILCAWVFFYPLIVIAALGGSELVGRWFAAGWQVALFLWERLAHHTSALVG